MDLQERFAPLMAQALHCASGEGLAMPLEAVQTRLFSLAEEERSALAFSSDLPDRLEYARFAVYAWADEKLLNAERPDAGAWLPLSLQCRYFSTTEAGHIFFTRLDDVLDSLGIAREVDGVPQDLAERLERACHLAPERSGVDVLRIFALCLLYGFRGRLFAEEELLLRVRKACRALLRQPETVSLTSAPSSSHAGQSLLGRLEPLFYVLVPVAVCALFWLFCADILAHIPVQGL
ncbi:MAG: DotU family type IV/VI secretion system protein [Desulfovibrionaceae bacterium]|nr:DotU family type IV/VI secretion system protein [Desulfovibrionaceae bacterium]